MSLKKLSQRLNQSAGPTLDIPDTTLAFQGMNQSIK
jgi:hypothetical protein